MGVRERKTREKENRIQSILSVAESVFAQKGFQNASMDEIARMAEIGKGTIYLYFKNKNDLYTAILINGLEKYHQRLIEIENKLDAGVLQSTDDIVMAFLRMNNEAYNEHPDSIFYQNYQLNQFLSKLSPDHLERLKEAGRKNLEIAREIITKAIRKKIFPDVNPAQVIDIFRAVVLGNIQLGESRILLAEKDFSRGNLLFSFALFSKAFEAMKAAHPPAGNI